MIEVLRVVTLAPPSLRATSAPRGLDHGNHGQYKTSSVRLASHSSHNSRLHRAECSSRRWRRVRFAADRHDASLGAVEYHYRQQHRPRCLQIK